MATKVRRANGEGSITKRKDGRWMARYWITLPDGSRRRQQIVGKDRQVVSEKLREEQVEAQRGKPRIRNQRTMHEYIEWWLRDIGPEQLRVSTLRYYTEYARRDIIPAIGNIPLTQLKPEHVREMMNRIKKQGRTDYCAHKTRQVLAPMLSTAVKLEYVHRNVAWLVKVPKYKPRTERTVWTKEQVAQFLDSIKNHRYYPIFLVMFSYGTRRGETIGLRWQDIDFDNNIIHIRQQLLHDLNRKIIFGEPKTEAGKRDLPLVPIVREALLKLRENPMYDGEVKDDLLFHTKIGTPIDGHTLVRLLGDLAYKAGLPRLTLHEIRHTVATMLKDEGVSPKDAQVILGHADIATTLAIYTHSSDNNKAKVLNRLSDSLFKANTATISRSI
ncbi:site-specific integrase [Alphaproteobacteria bacterium]|nr:site-specific integrase [Alphaproteobacteria bacterium]